jgi:hypothetical protein
MCSTNTTIGLPLNGNSPTAQSLTRIEAFQQSEDPEHHFLSVQDKKIE